MSEGMGQAEVKYEEYCVAPSPYMVFEASSAKFAKRIANVYAGLVAVPLDAAYAAETTRSAPGSPPPVYRFVALPADCAQALASGAAVSADQPEFTRAASLMVYAGVAKKRGRKIALADKRLIMDVKEQLWRIRKIEESIAKRALARGEAAGCVEA